MSRRTWSLLTSRSCHDWLRVSGSLATTLKQAEGSAAARSWQNRCRACFGRGRRWRHASGRNSVEIAADGWPARPFDRPDLPTLVQTARRRVVRLSRPRYEHANGKLWMLAPMSASLNGRRLELFDEAVSLLVLTPCSSILVTTRIIVSHGRTATSATRSPRGTLVSTTSRPSRTMARTESPTGNCCKYSLRRRP